MNKHHIRLCDIAYGCFLFLGATFLMASIVELLPINEELLIIFSTLLGIPLMLSSLLAGIVGTMLSIWLRKEWQLAIMGILTIGVPLAFWAAAMLSPLDQSVAGWYLIPYSLIATGISLQWFIAKRKVRVGKS